MRNALSASICLFALSGVWAVFSAPAMAHVSLGTGNAALLGGDLTDPKDQIAPSGKDSGSEAELMPRNAAWVKMTCWPVSRRYDMAYQPNPYQSWVGSPACAIFMNHPEQGKWYVSFKDGGYAGPTREDPYFVAVEFKDAFVLTHFTITPSGDSPDRDPREWAIQGSNTGEEGDWTDIYVCNAKDRSGTAFQEGSRNETFLFTSFNAAGLAKAVTPADAGKLQRKLGPKTITKADFARPAKAYTWFRVVVYSCFNASLHQDWAPAHGCALGQLELFGVPGVKEKAAPKVAKTEPPAKPPVMDAPFIITYWCGPAKAETTLERYKELAECGFNVAFAAIDNLWEPPSQAQDEHNRKFLDLCRQTGLKAFVWDGHRPWGDGKDPKPEELPQIEKALDGMIAAYSSHPAFLGFILGDECPSAHGRIGVLNQYLLKKDPKHLPYYNSLPMYYPSNPKAYERMVVDCLKTVKPALFSWDHYRQMFERGDERCYWDNLEIVRRNCLTAKVPYIQIIVSIKHMGYRECSEADLRWQVWTSLAYGSRGITYFTYCHVPGMAWGDAPGLLTKYGQRDAKYEYAKKINHRIAKLGPTLVKLVSTGVYCTDPLPTGTRPLLDEAPVKKADGGAMVIGCFQESAATDGAEYILPVNRSMSNAMTASLALDSKYVSTQEISQETGKPLPPVSVAGKTLDVPLEAGEGRLFLLNRKK